MRTVRCESHERARGRVLVARPGGGREARKVRRQWLKMLLGRGTGAFHREHPSTVAQLGRDVLRRAAASLAAEPEGAYLAVDVDSGKYFVGTTTAAAVKSAKEQSPSARLYLARVGHAHVFEFRSR